MFTSNFRMASRLPNAIAISRGVPSGFRGRHYRPLAPLGYMLGMSDHMKFARVYASRILERLDPYTLIEELGDDAVLLCWESPAEFCHRRLIAEWLKQATGLHVPEWSPPPAIGRNPLTHTEASIR